MSLSKQWIKPGKTIGIIGGGQLGRMMAFAAKEAGFRIVVLEPGADSPAGKIADEQIVAPYHDRKALLQLAEGVTSLHMSLKMSIMKRCNGCQKERIYHKVPS